MANSENQTKNSTFKTTKVEQSPEKITIQSEKTSTPVPTIHIAGLNEAVEQDTFAISVTNVSEEPTVGNSFTQKKAQGIFYIVTVKIENKGKRTETVDSSMLKVKDSEGREFERSIEGQTAKGMAEGNVDLFLTQIQPGLSITGDIVFDLPPDVKNPMLVFREGLFSEGATIKLK